MKVNLKDKVGEVWDGVKSVEYNSLNSSILVEVETENMGVIDVEIMDNPRLACNVTVNGNMVHNQYGRFIDIVSLQEYLSGYMRERMTNNEFLAVYSKVYGKEKVKKSHALNDKEFRREFLLYLTNKLFK